MKIVFMGTPDFAVYPLKKLHGSKHEVGYVVSQPDKEKGRGKKVKYTSTKEAAISLGIPVLQPETLKENTAFLNILREYEPDIIIVAAYGKLLLKEILELPKYGCINIHGSLLPKLRGAAPIQRAILDGYEKTGITIMQMEKGLDTGDMLLKGETDIDSKTFKTLYDELSYMGGELVVKVLDQIENGKIHATKQDDSQATYAEMIFKKDGKIDFSKSAVEIDRQVRALNPWPSTYTNYSNQLMKIIQGRPILEKNPGKIGEIVEVSKESFSIRTGNGVYEVTMIQLPGKKKILVKDYLVGNSIEKNRILE